MIDKSIGELIRAKRKELGWTVIKLSRASFVSVGHLNNVESGLRGLSNQTKQSIFDVLGLGGIENVL